MAKRTALELCKSAYRTANLEGELSGFSTVYDWPYSLALDAINDTLRELNRLGSFDFMRREVSLPYEASTYQYDLEALGVSPQRIDNLFEKDTGRLIDQVEWTAFVKAYRRQAVSIGQVVAYAKQGNSLELNAIPESDKELTLWYFADLPLVTSADQILPWPESHEDVLVLGIRKYILLSMGRSEANDLFALFEKGASSLLVEIKKDRGIPRVMPRAF